MGHCILVGEGSGRDDYPLVQLGPRGYCHTDHQNVLHCEGLGSVGAVAVTGSRCAVVDFHSLEEGDIGDLEGAVGAHKCLDVEFLQKEVAAEIGTEAVENFEEYRMVVEEEGKCRKAVRMAAVVGVVGCEQRCTVVVVDSVMHRRTAAAGHTMVPMFVFESMRPGVDYAVDYAVIEEYKCFGRWVGMMLVVRNQNTPLRNCPETNSQSCFPARTVSVYLHYRCAASTDDEPC